ncbi:hypothetical protein [Microbispora sp. CA-102843]|uniref:hypothetical protein n=1 Tax=Microbispora sp. CA-102843 TaxID=3239952 RepID=UPI003D93593B
MRRRAYPGDVLPLSVAEMDVPLAEPVARASTDAVALGDTGYPIGTAYAEALAGFARRRWGWDGVAVERTAMMPDVMRGVVELLDVLSAPTDAVVLNCPVYPPFYHFVQHTGRRVQEAPLGEDGRIDFTVLEEAFIRAGRHGPRPVYLLCNPRAGQRQRGPRRGGGGRARDAEHGARCAADLTGRRGRSGLEVSPRITP